MRLVRVLTERLRRLAPEAFAFGVIGASNSVLYFIIFNAAMGIGAVKATILATVVTTTLSYLANRHWTYRRRPRTALRREYTLFFAFNFAGMVIQSAAVGIGKYGFGLSEDRHRLAFNALTLLGIGLATVFRFWAYRTFVFLKAPLLLDEPVGAGGADARANRGAAPQPRLPEATGRPDELDEELTAALQAELAAELDPAPRQVTR